MSSFDIQPGETVEVQLEPVTDPAEIQRIQQVLGDEWDHERNQPMWVTGYDAMLRKGE
jgi:predicted Zn-dependent peptidase